MGINKDEQTIRDTLRKYDYDAEKAANELLDS